MSFGAESYILIPNLCYVEIRLSFENVIGGQNMKMCKRIKWGVKNILNVDNSISGLKIQIK